MLHSEFELTDCDFRKIADLVAATTGIVVGDRKRGFVHNRLGRRLRALGLKNFGEYCRVLDGPDGDAERHVLVNTIATNLTGFFREPHHFDFLAKTALPALIQGGNRDGQRLRIWSAGCATGEEAHSLAMILCDYQQPSAHWDMRILATDLDAHALAHAISGVYDAERMQSIPAELRHRYVTMRPNGHGSMSPVLRSLITFRSMNLLDEWPMRGPFDVILCRNVVISFDKPTQRILFDRFAAMLKPDGWLIVGHSETLEHLTKRFEPVGRTVYRRTR